MGLVPVERSFPRGGFKEQSVQSQAKGSNSRKHLNNKVQLFGKKVVRKKSELSASNKSNESQKKDKGPFYRLKQYTGQLTYKTVSEGLLVLGSIYKIDEFQLSVVLPGNVLGTVPITSISESYTVALRTVMLENSGENVYQLRDMFKVGQHVVTRVTSKVLQGNHNSLTLSLVPEVVYSDLSHTDIVKGSVVMASVKSIEEKGYVMDIGVKSTRAFLNKEKSCVYEEIWNNGRPLGIGQLVHCLVVKALTADRSTTAVLSAEPEKVSRASSDSPGATLETLVPGMLFTCTVSRRFPTGIQVQLSNNFVGYVHQDHFNKTFKKPDNYEIGAVVTARVLYILQSGAVYFTMKDNVLQSQPRSSPYEVIKLGAIVTAKVATVSEVGLTVKLGKVKDENLKGAIPLSQLPRKPLPADEKFEMSLGEQLAAEYPVGSSVDCRVMNYNYMDQYYLCSMDAELMKEKIIHADMLDVGMVVPCFVKSVFLKGINVTIGKKTRVSGFVPLMHISDVALTHPEKKFIPGQQCKARVLSMKDGKLYLTMKRSLVRSREPILSSFAEAQVGSMYDGTVLQVTAKGLLVQFYNCVTGWVPLKLIDSKPVSHEQMVRKFHVGQLLKCTIDDKEEENQRLRLSLLHDAPADVTEPSSNGVKGKEELSKTKQKKLKKKLAESIDEVSEEVVVSKKKKKSKKEVEEELNKSESKEKKLKKNKVLVDGEKLELQAELMSEPKQQSETPVKSKKEKSKKKDKTQKESNGVEKQSLVSISPTENGMKSKRKREESFTSDEAVSGKKSKTRLLNRDVKPSPKKPVELPALTLQSGFVWDATPDKLPIVASAADDPDSSDEEASSPVKPAKRSRHAAMAEKRAKARDEEARLRAVERRLMDAEQPPQSADEFDRLALSSPDSSMVWLQYMAFHLQATEIEKARSVAQRALKTISFREEQERLNVWMALLNLENLYGTKDSLETTLEEAVRVNDAYTVYTRMLEIFADSNKLVEGDKVVGILTRKFKDHKDMWVKAATFYMKSSQLEKARGLLNRALIGLQKKEHVEMICLFAHLENRLGEPVRAQTLMEQVLTSYPRRVDVWSAYVDMLVKSGAIDSARQVLERAVVQRLSSHKMKSLFKKFLSFEQAHGDEAGASRVRQMALDYVESAGSVG